MKRFCCLLMMLFAMLYVSANTSAQFPEDLDYNKRSIIFGGQFYNEEYALSGTVVVPEKVKEFEGFIAGHVNKVGDQWLAVARLEGGVDIIADWSLNLFTEFAKDQRAGDTTMQVGVFAESPRIEAGAAVLTFGLGNYLEGEQAETDLGLTDTDARVVRALTYGNLKYRTFNLLVKATPNAQVWDDASDMQLEIQPTLRLAKKLSLMTLFEYDSEPVKAGENWQISGGLQLKKDF